jgi:tRNA(His) 5'-end guanylyltransferase
MKNDALGTRMKEQYEKRAKTSLVRRTHTIVRVDGKAFHSYTRGLPRPYCTTLMSDMDQTAVFMCQHMQGAKMAYVQSDEISVLLTDYDQITTEAWFDGEQQKICSISAALATARLNQLRPTQFALFDARCFTIPEMIEVHNYFVWRQQDAVRNSIQMLAQAHFSPSTMHGVSCDRLQEMLWSEKQVNWAHCPSGFKNGRLIMRVHEQREIQVSRERPFVDVRDAWPWSVVDCPTFTQKPDFIPKLVADCIERGSRT